MAPSRYTLVQGNPTNAVRFVLEDNPYHRHGPWSCLGREPYGRHEPFQGEHAGGAAASAATSAATSATVSSLVPPLGQGDGPSIGGHGIALAPYRAVAEVHGTPLESPLVQGGLKPLRRGTRGGVGRRPLRFGPMDPAQSQYGRRQAHVFLDDGHHPRAAGLCTDHDIGAFSKREGFVCEDLGVEGAEDPSGVVGSPFAKVPGGTSYRHARTRSWVRPGVPTESLSLGRTLSCTNGDSCITSRVHAPTKGIV